MTPLQRTILWIYLGLIAIWPIRHLALFYFLGKLQILTPRSPRFSSPDPPLISAIIPARNEEQTLADCLDSVCAQTYPRMEILIVNDRSTDQTEAIAHRYAQTDPRVRVITIDHLPSGWTGKTHALHTAAAQARGEWFWFLDADTRHIPDSLSIVMEHAHVHRASLTSLLPGMRCETFWEYVVQPLAGLVLMQSFPPVLVNRNSSTCAFANGQYILIERAAYEQAGGHEAVRDRFVEDIYLARRVKALGLKIQLAIGTEIGSTRMYTSLSQLVRGWSRIFYDACGRRCLPLVIKMLDPLIFSQTAHVALLASLVMLALGVPGPFPVWLLILSLIHHLLAASVLYRLYRISVPEPRSVVWYPLAGLVLDRILYEAIIMCLTGRVTWRGTAYGPSAGGQAAGTPLTISQAKR